MSFQLKLNLFSPLLAGATLRDRLVACGGVAIGLVVVGSLMVVALPTTGLPLLVAPIGASAVLAFAVPSSPLAQPWSVIGGNVLSALVGVTIAALVPSPILAAGLAVAGAILLMTLARCLHPPGGAVALLAVLGGPAVSAAGYGFALMPVALNSLALAGAAWLFHRFSGHSYPHRADIGKAVPLSSEGLQAVDIERALADLGEPFDIAPEDLAILLARAEHHADERRAAVRVAQSSLRRAA